ncbi:MAG: L-threonylcarbamoyladenylate synthase [Bacteroidota bacterium]
MMKQEINNAIEVLRTSGIILYPTDTIWGIGCDATNKKAVEKILKIKQRAESKNLIVLVKDKKSLNKYVKKVPAIAWNLIELTDLPLTIIYEDARGLASNVIATDGSVGIRITSDTFCKKLMHKFGKPIVSTSANISGQKNSGIFSEIPDEIKKYVDYIVNFRQNETKLFLPSVIIKIKNNGEFTILRK